MKLVGAASAALLSLAACSAGSPASVTGHVASEREIEAHLNGRLKALAVAYPDARLSDFHFSRDRRIVCGRLTSPGKTPLLFASHDTTPETVEDRPLGIPPLTDVENWDDEKTARQQDRVNRQCRLAGLTVRADPAA